MSEIPQKPRKKLKTNKRKEIVRDRFIKLGLKLNQSELAEELGCDRDTIASDINAIRKTLNKESLDKYSDNILQEITQGQNIVRFVINRSVLTKDKDGVPLKEPVLNNCTEDDLLERLFKANRIKELDIKILEAWGMKEKVADKIEIEGAGVSDLRKWAEDYIKPKKT